MAQATATGDVPAYTHGRGLRAVLSIGFFLFLLFVINAGAGTVWLATHNLPVTAAIFGAMFILGLAILLYIGIFLFAASHTRLELAEDGARMVLPNWRGPMPLFPYTEAVIPYDQIAAVETRGEIYRYLLLPTLMRSVSILRKDGQRFTLGYIRESTTDPAVPFNEVAERIAERAGVSVNKRGVVDCGNRFRVMVQNAPSWDASECSPVDVEKARKSEKWLWIAAFIVVACAVVAAIAYQIIEIYVIAR
jgi:hypothetical protein